MTEFCKVSLQSKVKTYIGFAKKSGKIKIGTDNILAYKKNSVIIFSRDISDNAKNKLVNYKSKTGSTLVEIGNNLIISLLDSESIKAISIIDKSLGDACVNVLKDLEDVTVE